MTIRVFIQNEAGSNQKNYHDEKRLLWQRAVNVSMAYPFPYGFVLETSADDGDNVDCFVITDMALRTGQVVECEVIGLMEQFEDGQVDHNVLARLPGSQATVDEAVRGRLKEFVTSVFSHIPDKHLVVGRFLDAGEVQSHLRERVDRLLDRSR
jgi:inorganic pyrophosphatase